MCHFCIGTMPGTFMHFIPVALQKTAIPKTKKAFTGDGSIRSAEGTAPAATLTFSSSRGFAFGLMRRQLATNGCCVLTTNHPEKSKYSFRPGKNLKAGIFKRTQYVHIALQLGKRTTIGSAWIIRLIDRCVWRVAHNGVHIRLITKPHRDLHLCRTSLQTLAN